MVTHSKEIADKSDCILTLEKGTLRRNESVPICTFVMECSIVAIAVTPPGAILFGPVKTSTPTAKIAEPMISAPMSFSHSGILIFNFSPPPRYRSASLPSARHPRSFRLFRRCTALRPHSGTPPGVWRRARALLRWRG